MTTLTVGAGQQYATIAAAVAATHDGDTVNVLAGTYTNDFATIGHKITLQSVGGEAYLVATSPPPNGKAILTVDTDAVITGFGFTGAKVGDGNGAGIRYEGGDMTVNNCLFWGNQDGILGAAIPDGHIVINNSEFSQNGTGDGYTHNLYIGAVASLLVENSYFHDVRIGHEIKSRALSNTIINNRVDDNLGDASYSIDLPNGGVAVIQGNVIEKGVNAVNYTTIAFGEEGAYANSSLSVTGNTIVNDNASGFLLRDSAGNAPAELSNNQLWGFGPTAIAAGAVTQSGNATLAAKPVLDLTTLVPIPAPPGPAPTVDPPSGSHLVNFGLSGAVQASGRILTVGAGGQFATLATALVASKDGDTIEVAAGTYTNDFGTVNKKVIIEGVGGIAHFVDAGVWAGQGMLLIDADATLKNLDFSGTRNYNGRGGGLFVESGNVTIVNCSFENNDCGLWTADDATTTLSIYNSDIGNNGNSDKGTHNVYIGAIESFTLQDSYIHGSITGHELYDRAFYTEISGDRFVDGVGVQSSYSIDLGEGGDAIISNNLIEKGDASQNDILVNIGGEGSTYSNSNIRISNNTFVSDLNNPDHPYTFFIAVQNAGVLQAPTSVSNNVFWGGVPGSSQSTNASSIGNSTVNVHPSIDTSSPVSGLIAPVAFGSTVGPNILSLQLSEVKGYVDAQFIVSVDDVVIGGGLITADASADASQTFGFNGWWGAGPHQVTVTGTNLTDSIGPRAGKIVVSSISLDGSTVGQQLDLGNTSDTVTLAGTNEMPDFDATYYLSQYADVRAAGVDALTHYLNYGWKEGRNPNALFNTNYYLTHNQDVALAGINPLQHYEEYGWKEGRDPSSIFSTNTYEATHPGAASAVWDPLAPIIQSGGPSLLVGNAGGYAQPEAALFDVQYYLAHNADVAAMHVDALTQYESTGWREGRDPSASFSTNKYLAAYADVKAANVDPLAHYAAYGMHEGRQAFSA